jgi:hypothetical protein
MRGGDGTLLALGLVGAAVGVAAFSSRGSAAHQDPVGQALRQLLRSDESYALLDGDPVLAGTSWSEGGCGVLALALMRVLGDHATLYAIHSSDYPNIAQHFVVEYAGRFLDNNGSSTRIQLLKRFRTCHGGRGQQSLVRVTDMATAAATGRVRCPAGLVDKVVAYLGPPLRTAAGLTGSANGDAGPHTRVVRSVDPAEISRRTRAYLDARRSDWVFQGNLWGDNGPSGERQALRGLASAAGKSVLGLGGSRVVFALPGNRVLKVAYWGGETSNLNEVLMWGLVEQHPELAGLKECLAPVISHSGDGSWLVMARYPDLMAREWHSSRSSPDLSHNCRDLIKEFGIGDYTDSNLGAKVGEVNARFIDYGMVNASKLEEALRRRNIPYGGSP